MSLTVNIKIVNVPQLAKGLNDSISPALALQVLKEATEHAWLRFLRLTKEPCYRLPEVVDLSQKSTWMDALGETTAYGSQALSSAHELDWCANPQHWSVEGSNGPFTCIKQIDEKIGRAYIIERTELLSLVARIVHELLNEDKAVIAAQEIMVQNAQFLTDWACAVTRTVTLDKMKAPWLRTRADVKSRMSRLWAQSAATDLEHASYYERNCHPQVKHRQ